MNKILLPALLFLLLPLSVAAQEFNFPLPLGEKERALTSIIVGPALRTVFEGDRAGFFMLGLAVNPMFPGFKKEFGITDEQINSIMSALKSDQDMPDNVRLGFEALKRKLDEDINYVPTSDEEAEFESMCKDLFDKMNTLALDTFSVEQVQKMNGMMFALAGGLESPFLHEKHMVALQLTDEQKEQFKAINEETKTEREKVLGEGVAGLKRMFKTGKINFKDLEAAKTEFKGYSEDLKKRRSKVLTESQIAMVAELSKPPKFLTASPIGMMMPKWLPGAFSWKPGDPIPGQHQQEQEQKRTRHRPGFSRGDSGDHENEDESE